MSAPVKCFLLVETNKLQRYLRRYHRGDCPAPWKPFGGMNPLDVVEYPRNTVIYEVHPESVVSKDDPRWPQVCDCGSPFEPADEWQIFTERLYKRDDTGEEISLRTAPPGAMWDAWWYGDHYKGLDGLHMVVVCPGGHEWMIDSRASNCTMPDDNVHRCWCRHGEPPNLTVDKVGNTCGAGAGSIQAKNWHGFLRNGMLVE